MTLSLFTVKRLDSRLLEFSGPASSATASFLAGPGSPITTTFTLAKLEYNRSAGRNQKQSIPGWFRHICRGLAKGGRNQLHYVRDCHHAEEVVQRGLIGDPLEALKP